MLPYDEASVMSGHSSNKEFKQKLKMTLTVHCYPHRVNLVVVDSYKAVKFAADFALLQRLFIFLSGSYIHPKWLNIQNQLGLHPNERAIELKALA